MKSAFALFLAAWSVCSAAQDNPLPVIPRPAIVERAEGQFQLTNETVLVAGETSQQEADLLRALLGPATGFPLPPADDAGNAIILRLDPSLERLGEEGYRMEVSS